MQRRYLVRPNKGRCKPGGLFVDPVIPLKARKGALHVQGKFTNGQPPKNLWGETHCHVVGQQVSQPLYVTEA